MTYHLTNPGKLKIDSPFLDVGLLAGKICDKIFTQECPFHSGCIVQYGFCCCHNLFFCKNTSYLSNIQIICLKRCNLRYIRLVCNKNLFGTSLFLILLEAIKLLHGFGIDIVTHIDVRLHSLVVTVG